MKNYALLVFVCCLSACTAQPHVDWQAKHIAALSQTEVELSVSLWTDLMPKIGMSTESGNENNTINVNGYLVLQASESLPPSLTLLTLVLRQGDQIWTIPESQLELRPALKTSWEVVFNSALELDLNRPVSVALALKSEGKELWLVEHRVSIDKVY